MEGLLSKTEKATFFIPGDPVAKGRPKTRIMGKHVQIYTPTKTRKWEDYVRCFALEAFLKSGIKTWEDCPVRMNITFFMSRPKSHTKKQKLCPYCFRKPDRDNLEKSISDAIEGLFFKNDGQICDGMITKYYAEEPQEPGVYVELAKIETDE